MVSLACRASAHSLPVQSQSCKRLPDLSSPPPLTPAIHLHFPFARQTRAFDWFENTAEKNKQHLMGVGAPSCGMGTGRQRWPRPICFSHTWFVTAGLEGTLGHSLAAGLVIKPTCQRRCCLLVWQSQQNVDGITFPVTLLSGCSAVKYHWDYMNAKGNEGFNQSILLWTTAKAHPHTQFFSDK